VLSNVGLKMTINCDVEEVESLLPSGGLRETTNRCLAEVVSLLLSGGLRKTTNQSRSLVMLACCCSIDRTLKLEA
jgi:hypothetical protein